MKVKYNFVIQQVAGGFVAVAVGDDASKFNGLVRMNGTGAFILDQLKDDLSIDELVRRLMNEYEVTEEDALNAVRTYTNQLDRDGILIL